ncbi:ABC transporter ATP-binding protein [Collinsella sp. An2]|uniref:ABC transporter ATP-binding protein n=1 Tax=Collinsella sp. An2 TaxID=1965585 RepID=UPI000B37E2E2|nr:ABC transporter ATP-binding protein [Collinsella sp. An2]OUP09456.1 multidrug ABC transporter ATP-binding protein [Collinsella sp. An2]
MPAPGNKPQNLMRTLRELLSYMGRHKLLFLAVAVLVSISAVANLVGTYMIRPVVDRLAAGDFDGFVWCVIATAIIYATGVVAALGYTQLMVHAAQKVLFDIRRDLFAHIQTLPLRYFDTRSRGDIMSYFTNDVDTVAEAMNNSFALVIQSFIQIAGTLVMIFVLNWQLSLLVVVGYVAMFAYIRFSTKKSRSYFQRQQSVLGELDGYIEEMVTGQKVVKVFNHEAPNVDAFREKNERLRVAGTGAQAYAASMIPAVVSISYVNYAIVAVLGGFMAIAGLTDVGALASYLVFVRQTALPINQFTQQSNFLLSALAGAERVFAAMKEKPEVDEGKVRLVKTGKDTWAWQLPDGMGLGAWGALVPVAGGAAGAMAAGAVADAGGTGGRGAATDAGSADATVRCTAAAAVGAGGTGCAGCAGAVADAGGMGAIDAASHAPAEDQGALAQTTAIGVDGTVLATGLIPLRGDVRFHDVSFGYEAGHEVLHDLNLFAKPGQKIAFVGSTGAGKTTITNLINRFYDIDEGEITYDGINVKNIQKASLRGSLGIVLQDTHLFTGTIAENIRFGKLDATDEEVRHAAHLANADSFIRRLPQGYDTMVTSDGANLSQGQRQLLAIARAAVADPPVLILDEATSSIDTRTEALIERGMDALMRGRTTFMIAHRLSTVRNADAIMVLDHGRIIERGTHEELYALHGEYWKLCQGLKELD